MHLIYGIAHRVGNHRRSTAVVRSFEYGSRQNSTPARRIGGATCDALVFGYYEGSKLLYVSRTRNGFTPRVREELLKRFRGLEIAECPFANLPEAKNRRWGQVLTTAKIEECRWLKP